MQVIDLTYIHSVSEDNEIIKNLIDIFKNQLDEFEKELTNSFANKDYKMIASIAHKAKSSIISMGMEDLAQAMKKLELLAKTLYVENPLPNDKNIEDIQHQLITMPEELKTWIVQNKTPKAIEELINFYKLQSVLAKADLKEI